MIRISTVETGTPQEVTRNQKNENQKDHYKHHSQRVQETEDNGDSVAGNDL